MVIAILAIVFAIILGLTVGLYDMQILRKNQRIHELESIIQVMQEYISDIEYSKRHNCCCDSEMLDIDSPKE